MTYDATYAKHYASQPDLEEPGARTWLTRGANFVVAVTQAAPGAVLARSSQVDEYMVFLPDASSTIQLGKDRLEAGPETVTIVPPGESGVTVKSAGTVVRIFSNQAKDLLERAGNASTYAKGAPGTAHLDAWPDPVGGFKLRHYRVADYEKPDSNLRIFRSTNLMLNVLKKRGEPRDVRKLSPHSHADFEQASLAISGTYVHHLRWPWTPDMSTWRADEHVEMGSPSVLIIPPKVIHTSQNVRTAGWLVDVFSPPRLDFSAKPGLVCNADDYPLPAGVDLSKFAGAAAA